MARAEYARFAEAWKEADPGRAEVAETRRYLAGEEAVASVEK